MQIDPETLNQCLVNSGIYRKIFSNKSKQRSLDVISGLVRMNLEIMRHDFCERHAQLSKWRAYCLENARFGRYGNFSKDEIPRFSISADFSNWIPNQGQISTFRI